VSMTVDMRTGRITAEGESVAELRRQDMRASPAQVRRALHRMGRLAQVNAIAATNPEAQILWEYATVIERRSPFIDALGREAFTPAEIDAVFDLAVTL
jgi:hypothetical protein